MMQFRQVKNAVQNLLGNSAAGRYRVAGFQRQEKDSQASKNNNRLVQVYFKSEDFESSMSSYTGNKQGDVSISIDLTVSAPSQVDLTVIQNPNASQADLQNAISQMNEAGAVADDLFDELADILWNILMDARNYNLGFPKGTVSNRWVSAIRKDQTNPRGSLVVLTGKLEFSCRVSEEVLGDTGVESDSIDIENEINNDPVQKTGINV